MKIVIYIIILLFSCQFFFSCDDNDSFSSSSDLRLSFSNDTVRFDTVFTSFGTATKRLKVYNDNKKALTIESIELIHPETSGFRINVDGESGNIINNVDILGKDSIYIFVEVTVDPLNQNNPLLITDSIRFSFNGINQHIRLEAIGMDITFWKAKTIDKDTTLTGEKPFLIYDSLYIKKGAKLNIEKNVKMYFHKGAFLSIDGNINVAGTIEEPVVFRADRTDNLLESPRVPYDRVPGQWYGIKIGAGSFNNNFENVRIRNGIYGVLCAQSDTTELKASFLNTVIQNTTKEGLFAINCKIEARNSLFANSGGYTVKLIGGSYYFLHCTIANYLNQYWLSIRKKAMEVANTGLDIDNKDISEPLGKCLIVSSIIAGSSNKEVDLTNSEKTTFNYMFMNCLFRDSGEDDSHFINTVWGADPLFKYIYTVEEAKENPQYYFYYDFRLTEASPAINRASRQYATELPYDLNGVSRRSDEAPDIGCFEYKAE